MKFRTEPSFEREFSRLPREHRHLFLAMLYGHLLPALAAGAHRGMTPWPKRLRVHKLTNSDVYSMTWSFASPDGRATFHFEKDDDGEPMLVWGRIGNHSIYE
ncbi:hypothetical protein [Streptosporangium roseum]|uniref:hypothetical protein n=1 Tax=Streptosporangium roseum TaxID=2001 RepID=UPI0033245256